MKAGYGRFRAAKGITRGSTLKNDPPSISLVQISILLLGKAQGDHFQKMSSAEGDHFHGTESLGTVAGRAANK